MCYRVRRGRLQLFRSHLPVHPGEAGRRDVRIVAAEPAACPTLTRGVYAYDFGDTAKLTPLVKMHTLGHAFVPAGIHAGGLRYHGAAPLVSHLLEQGLIEAVAVNQRAAFEAAIAFGRSEGIIPAPESAHAIRAAIDEANAAKEAGEARTILIGLSGHGNFDLAAYDALPVRFAGRLRAPPGSHRRSPRRPAAGCGVVDYAPPARRWG